MKYLFALLLLMTLSASAQTDKNDVKKPIIQLFDGMRKSDSILIRTAFAPQAIMQTVVKNKEGNTETATEAVDDFIKAIAQPHTEIYDERITFDVIRIDGDLAMVWAPYQFYIGNKFSHCGVDSFQLIKINGTWKIQYIIDTRKKEGCR